jgi:hypothetical protein
MKVCQFLIQCDGFVQKHISMTSNGEAMIKAIIPDNEILARMQWCLRLGSSPAKASGK